MKNKLLFKALAGEKKFEAVTNAAGTEATLYVYDEIVSDEFYAEYFGGVSSKQFIEAINNITAPIINMRINSPGGEVFAARTMETAIKNHSSKVIAHIDGIAASAASILAIAADEVIIAPGGFFMIHNALTCACGNKNDMAQTIEILTKVDESLADSYEAKTGADKKKIAKMMDAETWLNANESVDLGLADSIAEFAVKNSIKWDLSAFTNAPQIDAEIEPVIDLQAEAEKSRIEKERIEKEQADELAASLKNNDDKRKREIELALLS